MAVSFNRRVAVHKSLHLRDYSKQERQDTWYTRKEMDAIKEDANETLTMMKKSRGRFRFTVDNIELLHCTRGLETRLKKTARTIKTNRKKSITVVIEEQKKQKGVAGNTLDQAELIALAYAPYTLAAVQNAFDYGLLDESDAFFYHLEGKGHAFGRERVNSATTATFTKGEKTMMESRGRSERQPQLDRWRRYGISNDITQCVSLRAISC